MNRLLYIILSLLFVPFGAEQLMAQSDSLSHYLEVAAQNNPGIRAAYQNYQASLQQIPQAGALPDLQLDMGFYAQPMDIIDGKQVADFTLMQMFPWFGARKAARNEAEHMSDVAFEQYRESLDNLYLDVYTQWYELASLKQKLYNLDEHRGFLKQLEELAIRRFSTSSGNDGEMSSTLRVRLESVELDNEVEKTIADMESGKARFNALLNRSSDAVIVLPDSVEEMMFVLDVPSAMEQISAQSPALKMIMQEQNAYKAKAESDKKASMPMIGVGLQYSLINKRSGEVLPVTSMNGMDMWMPMVSVSLPIWRGKYKAQQKQSQYYHAASAARYNDTYNNLQAELVQLKHGLENSRRTLGLLEKQSNLALTTYNLVVREFATGKSTLNDVIEVQRQLLDYRLRRSDAIAEYNTQVAEAQKLISFNANNIQQR